MDKILVVQLARMGDFLQTAPLLSGLKKKYSEAAVEVLVDERVRDVADHCPSVDGIHCLPGDAILSTIAAGDTAGTVKLLKKTCSSFMQTEYSRVINLNLSGIASVAGAAARTANRTGYGYCNETGTRSMDPWFSYFYSTVRYRRLDPYNLADFFYFSALSRYDETGENRYFKTAASEKKYAESIVKRCGIDDGKKIISLQLGTRCEKRSWPKDYFTELAVRIARKKEYHVFLLGTAADSDCAAACLQAAAEENCSTGIHDFTGRTSIGELAALLECSDLLISCDTGAMHLASAVGTKVLALFFGPAVVSYTGPYGPGHYVLRDRRACSPCLETEPCCLENACKYSIVPETVKFVADAIVSQETIHPLNVQSPELLVSDVDEYGTIYEPVAGAEPDMQNLQNTCYRLMGASLVTEEARDTSGVNSCLPHDADYLRSSVVSLVHMSDRLGSMQKTRSHGLFAARYEQDYAFWHPWIDFYLDACKQAKDESDVSRAAVLFSHGLHVGRNYLQSMVVN